jgi:hypothetical protein
VLFTQSQTLLGSAVSQTHEIVLSKLRTSWLQRVTMFTLDRGPINPNRKCETFQGSSPLSTHKQFKPRRKPLFSQQSSEDGLCVRSPHAKVHIPAGTIPGQSLQSHITVLQAVRWLEHICTLLDIILSGRQSYLSKYYNHVCPSGFTASCSTERLSVGKHYVNTSSLE